MPLETGTRINDLTVTNPTSSDPVGQGDDHLRLIKSVLVGTLPNMGNILGQVIRQDTAVSISSTWNTSHLVVSNSATATVVLTMPPAASITSGFYIDITTLAGATASIDGSGAETVNGAATAGIAASRHARVFYDNNVPGWRLVSLADLSGDNLSVAGTLSVSGNTTLGGTLSVTGATHINGSLSVSGAASLNSTLTVSGAATLNSTLTVSGIATFKSAVSIGGAVTVAGAMTISGVATLKRGISISGTLALLGDLLAVGNAVVTGSLSVSGNTVLTGNLNANGAVSVASSLSVSGVSFLGSNLQVNGPTVITDSLSVSGVAIFDSAVTCKSVLQAGSLSVSGAVNFASALNLSAGQIVFPATQNPSANANTLDDYEEGTFTPTVSFGTPGNLAVTYSTQTGVYTKVGRLVEVSINIATSAFTHTTASGNFLIGTLPFTPAAQVPGGTDLQGITRATATQAAITTVASSTSMLIVLQNVSTGAARVIASTTDVPSGGTLNMNFGVCFNV